MTIQKVFLPVRPFPKPRGQLNKYGKMTHSLNGYRQWQKQFHDAISSTTFQIPEPFYGVLFHFCLKPQRGHPPDVSNLQGGVEDVLVKFGFITDDNVNVMPRYASWAEKTKESSITLYVVQNKVEFLFILEKFMF